MQPPTPGRIVWYYADETCEPVAAIVNTGKPDAAGRITLTVFRDIGGIVVRAPECPTQEPQWGFWSWMPYQVQKAERPEGNQSESAVPLTEGGPVSGTPTEAAAASTPQEVVQGQIHPDQGAGPTGGPDGGDDGDARGPDQESPARGAGGSSGAS